MSVKAGRVGSRARLRARGFAFVSVAAALLLIAAGPADAGARKRTVTRNYVGFGGATAAEYPNIFVQDQLGTEGVGGVYLEGAPKERFVSVRATDATGVPIAIRVIFVKRNASEFSQQLVCEKTARPIEIHPGSDITIFPVIGTCPDQTPSVPVRGEIAATFMTR